MFGFVPRIRNVRVKIDYFLHESATLAVIEGGKRPDCIL